MQCGDHKNPAVTDASSVPEWFCIAYNFLPQSDREDRGEDMPWAMAIVLEVPKKERPSRTALLRAIAMAAAACCLNEHAGDDISTYQRSLAFWYGMRIHKSTRRARNIGWQRVQLAPGVTMEVDGVQARVLVPTPIDETYPEIAKLQISGTDLSYDDPKNASSDNSGGHGSADTFAPPVIWVDKNLNMPAGEVVARAGHGPMLYAAIPSVEGVWAWAQNGYALDVKEVSREQWPAPEFRAIEVQDVGFTEIAPGSVTVAVTSGAVTHD